MFFWLLHMACRIRVPSQGLNLSRDSDGSESQLSRQSEPGLEKNFQTQSISEGSEILFRTKSRENVGTVSTGGRPPERPGRADSFQELIDSRQRKFLLEGWH